ncbi:MAG: PIN/TRAM domain-containing protein [bacterium]
MEDLFRRSFIVLSFSITAVMYGFLTNNVLFSSLFGLALGSYLAVLDWHIQKYSFKMLLCGSLGFLAGLSASIYFINSFFAPVTFREPIILVILGSGIYLGTYIGYLIARKWPEPTGGGPFRQSSSTPPATTDKNTSTKIVDTSVIIDGRIAEIIEIGFLEGKLIVPRFILQELQNMADSGNNLKRNRGRRGLDILNRIRDELDIPVNITEKDYPDVPEVDAKLVELAKDTGANIITNDFNLNKVASLQDVSVLNLNDLSNAVKPVYIPGESFEIEVIKEGEEKQQGVGYLEDGTMVVIEDAIDNIGEDITVTVTSVIQTSAGRMIFAQKGDNNSIDES